MARKYEQRRRAEQQEETRHRIVVAAVDLHGTIGPARTSLSAVAERAGVQRNTLYRHFPDERSLYDACSAHYTEAHPLPEAEGWAVIADPRERTRHGLGELYAYWHDNREMIDHVLRDAETLPVVREVSQVHLAAPLGAMRSVLLDAWPAEPAVTATVDLALGFRTWQSLTASGLSGAAAADLMADLVAAAAARS